MECPKCGRDGTVYFDAGAGCYECGHCGWQSKGYYRMPVIKPAYAVKLGKGVFAGACWQCSRCGDYVNTNGSNRPSSSGCSAGGNHFWVKEHD